MSNPSYPPGNAAPAAPVNPGPPAASVPGAAADDGTQPASTLNAQPAPVPLPAVRHAAPEPPLPSQAPAPSGEQIKYHRGPALVRPHGPSLLTQALATARGIHVPAPAELALLTKSHSPTPSPDTSTPSDSPQWPLREADEQPTQHATSPPSDGDSLTPRGSPQTGKMTASTAVAMTVAYPYGPAEAVLPATYNVLDLGEVNSMLSGHREFLTKSKGRGTSLERTDRERRAQQDQPSRSAITTHISANSNALLTPPFTESPAPLQDGGANYILAASDTATDPRGRKLDHRLSMGPEKAWSINTEKPTNCQDGQVEKSIAEAITGIEPNARTSRKASHSLRFFKEGNPEEKGKKKESRLGQHPREKLVPTAESPEAENAPALAEGAGLSSQPPPLTKDKSVPAERPPRTRTISTRTSEAPPISASPEELVDVRGKAPTRSAAAENLSSRPVPVGHDRPEPEADKRAPDSGPESRRKSDASTGAGEITEEGEESGEEKISSAVFLPHQGPEQSEEDAPVHNVPPSRAVPTRTLSRTDDFHPWLVKADEPEVDEERRADVEGKQRLEPVDGPVANVAPEVVPTHLDGPTIADERETVALPPKLSRPASQYQEDAVHDHQWPAKQPLETIELIPYMHQVGGHTTLWRFSRRAVCKQLNNRENEFYEKVEKYHRDLLAFLPRYIGVLNVTFQKKQRRKSTVRRDGTVVLDRSQADQVGSDAASKLNGTVPDEDASGHASTSHQRVISQSLQAPQNSVPTVTFVDNQHILPRSLLQPSSPSGPSAVGRFRSASAATHGAGLDGHTAPTTLSPVEAIRPSLKDHHQAHSWGATTVNKQLRNEVFNDAFLKRPIAIHHHRKGHRVLPRRSVQQTLRSTGSDPSLLASREKEAQTSTQTSSTVSEQAIPKPSSRLASTESDIDQQAQFSEEDESAPKDVTGTSAPEPEILEESSPAAQKRKRRYSGTGLRRKPKDVQDARGDLKYFEEADDAEYKRGKGVGAKDATPKEPRESVEVPQEEQINDQGQQLDGILSTDQSTAVSERIPRPVNPKEAQTQRDSRVEYFLLLEDLTAGMKRPCIMDLKMGTRQYGVEANAAKQKSQKGKCAKTTSRELGVRVCGLQVWDVKSQRYVFKDKYYGRDLKKGHEFQGALTRFLYDGVEKASILRHIPTVLAKLDQLEVIIGRLRGYRFYAASLLMFYDGEPPGQESSDATAAAVIEDSTTDFATDTEDAPRRARKNPREIDFKMADFANCVAAGDDVRDKPCPPRHPTEPDRGFLRGLRSLRKYFLKIQRDTRAEMGMVGAQLRSAANAGVNGVGLEEDEEGEVSE